MSSPGMVGQIAELPLTVAFEHPTTLTSDPSKVTAPESVLEVPPRSSRDAFAYPSPNEDCHQTQPRLLLKRKDLSRSDKHVVFKDVDIFYFERSQGFVCVPSQGGSSLGMVRVHSACETLSVLEHQCIRRLERYSVLLRKYRAGKIMLTPQQLRYISKQIKSSPTTFVDRVFPKCSPSICDSGDTHSTVDIHDCVSDARPRSPALQTPVISPAVQREDDNERPDEDSHFSDGTEDESSVTNDELETQLCSLVDCYFLQLVPVKKRRMILRKAGLRTIDHLERVECQAIRLSREICGCSCSGGVCLPDKCYCARNGIRCQVDRALFPCSCVESAQCQNPEGRIEFDPVRVRTHYLHTRLRLDVERAQQPSNVATLGSDQPTRDQMVDLEEPPIKKWMSNSSFSPDVPSSTPTHSSTVHDDPILSAYNTTVHGACRDCQSDRYVHMLMQQIASSSSSSDHGEPADTSYVDHATNDHDGILVLPTTAACTFIDSVPSPTGVTTISQTDLSANQLVSYKLDDLDAQTSLPNCAPSNQFSCQAVQNEEHPVLSAESSSDLLNNLHDCKAPALSSGGSSVDHLYETEKQHMANLRPCPLEPISLLFAQCVASDTYWYTQPGGSLMLRDTSYREYRQCRIEIQGAAGFRQHDSDQCLLNRNARAFHLEHFSM
ncbi:hypothetical protein PHET_04608 [Paragonimus heterotremus]|uniref:Cysteine/serine-rich nuclear protein N-terminal domain-containing protein n=1 Tax=Paragonimus heterotremus TaxID=100268 RepID=A0A8J4SY20_9TREM|nr:hypothetical protein PHET_04608 [Paragonimus heterotremus]